MNNEQKGIVSIAIIGLVILVLLAVAGTSYFLLNNKPQIACTMEAKICPDGSSVGRTGPNCEFAACPVDETVGWKTQVNTQYGFGFKYPSDFFNSNQEPKILVGDCNYSVFPDKCPSINDIVIKDSVSLGGDINIIKSNLSSANYWKNPNGEKSTINNTTYCLYQTEDAATGHVYNYYYYATVTNNKCLVVSLSTSTANCDFYLPIEQGNAEQQQNYNNCLTTNQNKPIILKKIISTFKFTN